MITMDQARDQLQTATTASLAVRCLTQRCRESVLQDSPNQDYAVLVAATPPQQSYSFCVADGVGSAFLSHFASRYLSERLVAWLAALPVDAKPPPVLTQELAAALARWAPEAQAELARLPLAARTPELVREVMAELRDTQGSQTVFCAGRIDRTPTPTGSGAAQVLLCWMGNIDAQIWPTATQCEEMNAGGDDRQRWSTRRGPHGTPSVRLLRFPSLHRMIVSTDGFVTKQRDIAHMTDAELQACAQQLLTTPINDDMTVLDLTWRDE